MSPHAPHDNPAELTIGAIRWLATPAGVEILQQADAWASGRLDTLELVKENPVRRIYRIPPPADSFLKVCDETSLSRRLKRRLRGPAARIEWDNASAVLAAGVPTPQPLAVGVTDGASLLLTASCQPAVDLDDYLDEHGWSDEVAAALGNLLEKTYAAGVLHADLHAGNILYRPDEGRMWLLDLQKARVTGSPATPGQVARNLGVLVNALRTWADDDQLAELLAGLSIPPFGLAHGPEPVEGLPADRPAAVFRAADRHERRHQRSRDRDVLQQDKYLARLRTAGWRAWVYLRRRRPIPGSDASRLTFTAADWAEALADPAALVHAPPGEGERVYKESGTSRVIRRRIRVAGQELTVFVKHYPWRRRLAALADPFRASRAVRSFRIGHQLLNRRVPTALPLAALERRWGPVLLESIVITEAVEDTVHLERFAREGLGSLSPGPARRARTTIARRLGLAIRRLKLGGFTHRDMKAPNVLVACAPDGDCRVVLVDLDGCRPTIRRMLRIMDLTGVSLDEPHRRVFAHPELVRLNADLSGLAEVTRTDRLRTLRSMVGGSAIWKQMCRAVVRGTRRRLARREGREGNPPKSQ